MGAQPHFRGYFSIMFRYKRGEGEREEGRAEVKAMCCRTTARPHPDMRGEGAVGGDVRCCCDETESIPFSRTAAIKRNVLGRARLRGRWGDVTHIVLYNPGLRREEERGRRVERRGVEDRGWKVESGGWKVEGGGGRKEREWKAENLRWRMARISFPS